MRVLALITIASCLFALPASVSAQSTTDKIIGQCVNDGTLSGNYSQSDYSSALESLPSDVSEYTDCIDVIHRAQLADAGVGSGSTQAASSNGEDPVVVPASAEEAKAIKAVQRNGDSPVNVAGEIVTPGASGFTPAVLSNRLPTPLLIVLFLIVFGVIAGALVSARAKRRSRR